MSRNYKSLSAKRALVDIITVIMCFPALPGLVFAGSGTPLDTIQVTDPANSDQGQYSNDEQEHDSVNDHGTDLYNSQAQSSQSDNEGGIGNDSRDSQSIEPEEEGNGEDSQAAKLEDGDNDKDSQATETEDGDGNADSEVTEPMDETENSQTAESENGDSGSQAIEPKEEDEDSQAADQKDADVALDKSESTPPFAPELTDEPEEEYGDENETTDERLLNIISFELIFDDAPMALRAVDNDNSIFSCGFGLLITDTENDLEYSFILSSENNRIEIPNGTYSVAAGSIAPKGYQITDVPSELIIDTDQEENLVIPISCGKGGRRGFFATAACEFLIIGNEDAQSLVSAIEFDGLLEPDMAVEGEDPLLEQELSGEPDPESLVGSEPENESGLTSSLLEENALEEDDAIAEESPDEESLDEESPNLFDLDNSVSPPGQDNPAELLDGSDFEGQRLSDLPGHTDYSDSDAVLNGVVFLEADYYSARNISLQKNESQAPSSLTTEPAYDDRTVSESLLNVYVADTSARYEKATINELYKELILRDLK